MGERRAEADLQDCLPSTRNNIAAPTNVKGDCLAGLRATDLVSVVVDKVFNNYFPGGRKDAHIAKVARARRARSRNAILGETRGCDTQKNERKAQKKRPTDRKSTRLN